MSQYEPITLNELRQWDAAYKIVNGTHQEQVEYLVDQAMMLAHEVFPRMRDEILRLHQDRDVLKQMIESMKDSAVEVAHQVEVATKES